jgi:hypothetical protein
MATPQSHLQKLPQSSGFRRCSANSPFCAGQKTLEQPFGVSVALLCLVRVALACVASRTASRKSDGKN